MKRSHGGTFQKVQKSLKKNPTVAATPRARGNFVYGPVRHNIPQRLCARERFCWERFEQSC